LQWRIGRIELVEDRIHKLFIQQIMSAGRIQMMSMAITAAVPEEQIRLQLSYEIIQTLAVEQLTEGTCQDWVQMFGTPKMTLTSTQGKKTGSAVHWRSPLRQMRMVSELEIRGWTMITSSTLDP
jgi:hypothetical protein